MLAQEYDGQPDAIITSREQVLVLLLALFGAAAGWIVIPFLGRPGASGLLRDIGVAVLALALTFSIAAAGLALPPPLAPLVLLLSLGHPLTGSVLVIGCAVLLAYARMTVAKDSRPATSPPA